MFYEIQQSSFSPVLVPGFAELQLFYLVLSLYISLADS